AVQTKGDPRLGDRHPPGLATPPVAKESEAPRDEPFAPLVLEGDQSDARGLGIPRQVVAEHRRDAVVPAVVRALPCLEEALALREDFTVGRRDPPRGREGASR